MSHLHPVMYQLYFADTGVVTSLIRCTLEHLLESEVATVSNKDTGESYGSIELLNGQLIINDIQDPHMIFVQDVLSDLL